MAQKSRIASLASAAASRGAAAARVLVQGPGATVSPPAPITEPPQAHAPPTPTIGSGLVAVAATTEIPASSAFADLTGMEVSGDGKHAVRNLTEYLRRSLMDDGWFWQFATSDPVRNALTALEDDADGLKQNLLAKLQRTNHPSEIGYSDREIRYLLKAMLGNRGSIAGVAGQDGQVPDLQADFVNYVLVYAVRMGEIQDTNGTRNELANLLEGLATDKGGLIDRTGIMRDLVMSRAIKFADALVAAATELSGADAGQSFKAMLYSTRSGGDISGCATLFAGSYGNKDVPVVFTGLRKAVSDDTQAYPDKSIQAVVAAVTQAKQTEEGDRVNRELALAKQFGVLAQAIPDLLTRYHAHNLVVACLRKLEQECRQMDNAVSGLNKALAELDEKCAGEKDKLLAKLKEAYGIPAELSGDDLLKTLLAAAKTDAATFNRVLGEFEERLRNPVLHGLKQKLEAPASQLDRALLRAYLRLHDRLPLLYGSRDEIGGVEISVPRHLRRQSSGVKEHALDAARAVGNVLSAPVWPFGHNGLVARDNWRTVFRMLGHGVARTWNYLTEPSFMKMPVPLFRRGGALAIVAALVFAVPPHGRHMRETAMLAAQGISWPVRAYAQLVVEGVPKIPYLIVPPEVGAGPYIDYEQVAANARINARMQTQFGVHSMENALFLDVHTNLQAWLLSLPSAHVRVDDMEPAITALRTVGTTEQGWLDSRGRQFLLDRKLGTDTTPKPKPEPAADNMR